MTGTRRGQVMILTVLALGGTLLGATTVAGLLTLYQIRNSTDLANSARAIFAADAGIEWGLYNFSCSAEEDRSRNCPAQELGEFSNGATVQVICGDDLGNEVACNDPGVASLKSVGSAGGSSRAFEASF
jgi:hypothetical protein